MSDGDRDGQAHGFQSRNATAQSHIADGSRHGAEQQYPNAARRRDTEA